MSEKLSPAKKNSVVLTEGPNRAAARSYLRGVGFSKEDLHKPIIGIAQKIPEEALQEDEKLLLWYDQALTRTEADA